MTDYSPEMAGISARQVYSTKLAAGSIRVIDLEPGSGEDRLIGALRCVSLSEAEDTYDAISYVWGDPKNTCEIVCNGVKLDITVSLALVLRTVRHATQRLTLWADAICINQNDAEEKGQQVKQMGKVYESAKRVLVNLGHDEDGVAQDCFSLLGEFNLFWGQQLREHGGLRKVRNKAIPPFHSDTKRWEAVAQLFALPWFDRLWVVQEAGLAKECIVQWGDATISFAEVVELVLWFHCRADIAQHARSDVTLKWSDIFLKAQCMLGNRTTWRTDLPLCALVNDEIASAPENKSFIELLRTGRFMKTSDPRDHVYGFLSSPLALSDDGRQAVEPDYEKPLKEVYFDMACALLENRREAKFLLGAVDHQSILHFAADDGWPSWVPRWDQGHWTTALAVPYNWYFAGGPKDDLLVQVAPGGLLSLQGIIFDRLSWVSESLSEHDLGVSATKWSREFQEHGKSPIEHLWGTVQASCHYDVDNLEDIFMVTLCREYPSSQAVKASGVQMPFLRDDFRAYRRLMKRAAESLAHPRPRPGSARPGQGSGRAIRFSSKISACQNRKLAHTKAGRMVLTPRFAETNDICCIFPGVPVPFILRESEQSGIYHLVGDSYVYGVMRGEIIEKQGEGIYKLETVYLK